MALDVPDRLDPLNDDLTDWLDGGPGQTRAHGNPVGVDAPEVELGTRLQELARLALTELGDGASGVGVYTDLWPPAMVAALTGANVQAALDHLVRAAVTRESLSLNNPIPASQVLYFDDEFGINVLAVPWSRFRAGTMTQIAVIVDVAEDPATGNDYRIEIYRRNTSSVIAFVDLLKGNIIGRKDLSVLLSENDELQPRIALLTGSGRSSFRRVKLSIETTE